MKTDKSSEDSQITQNSNSIDHFVSPIYPESETTGKILEAAFAVHNALGPGFLEKVYENALAIELRDRGLNCEQQKPVSVSFKGLAVGDYIADIVVCGRILIEMKACSGFDSVHQAQTMNYMKASRLKVGLLLNFGRPRLEYKRIIA